MPTGIYKRTKKHRKKLSKAAIGNTHGFRKGHKIKLGIKHSCKTKEKISETKSNSIKTRRGKTHWNWQGGKTKIYKHSDTGTFRYKEWRTKVFIRDNFTCQICRKVGIYLQPHHIKSWTYYPKLRYEVSNGITLCVECHRLIHKLLR